MTSLLGKRRAGILLHITSLPGAGTVGDLGQEAYHFVRFLHDTGITVWQTLPLGITHAELSPYQSLSAHAGNPELISVDWLCKQGWLRFADIAQNPNNTHEIPKNTLLTKAFHGFLELGNEADVLDFDRFCQDKSFWLDDFALFMALRTEFH